MAFDWLAAARPEQNDCHFRGNIFKRTFPSFFSNFTEGLVHWQCSNHMIVPAPDWWSNFNSLSLSICISKLTITGSDNDLSPGRRQAIIGTNAGILLIGPMRTNFNEISIDICTFSCKKMHLTMSSAKWRPFCLGINVLKRIGKTSTY